MSAKSVTGEGGISPLLQGSFDNLCSLYSIVNGVRLALLPLQLSKTQSRALFNRGMHFLENEECGEVVRLGLNAKDWHRVARHLFDYLDDKNIADLKGGKTAFRLMPEDLGAAIEMVERAVARGTPVAIELKKAWNHYTVVAGVDADAWRLFDSHGHKRVKKSALGLSGSGARHELGARAILFMPRF